MLVCRLYGDKRHFIRPAQITGKNGHILGLVKPFFGITCSNFTIPCMELTSAMKLMLCDL